MKTLMTLAMRYYLISIIVMMNFKKTSWGTSKMGPKVKVFAVKPHDLNLFPRTHTSEKRKLTPGSPLTSTHIPWLVNTQTRTTHKTHTHTCTHIDTQTYTYIHTYTFFKRRNFLFISSLEVCEYHGTHMWQWHTCGGGTHVAVAHMAEVHTWQWHTWPWRMWQRHTRGGQKTSCMSHFFLPTYELEG